MAPIARADRAYHDPAQLHLHEFDSAGRKWNHIHSTSGGPLSARAPSGGGMKQVSTEGQR